MYHACLFKPLQQPYQVIAVLYSSKFNKNFASLKGRIKFYFNFLWCLLLLVLFLSILTGRPVTTARSVPRGDAVRVHISAQQQSAIRPEGYLHGGRDYSNCRPVTVTQRDILFKNFPMVTHSRPVFVEFHMVEISYLTVSLKGVTFR